MGFGDLRTPDKSMALISAMLLAAYFAICVYALVSPSQYDPQQGMAIGFIVFVCFILLLLAATLWFAVARKHPWVIRTVFGITIFPAISQTAQEIFLLVHRTQ
jgi:hypothetical protein